MEAEIKYLRSEICHLKDVLSSLLKEETKTAVRHYKEQKEKPLKERKIRRSARKKDNSSTGSKKSPSRRRPSQRVTNKSHNASGTKRKKTPTQRTKRIPAHYTCDICAEEFNDLMCYNKHLVGHEMTCNVDFGGFSCPLCDKKFENLPSLFIHQSWHAKSDDIVCVKCKAIFKKRDDLTIHHHKEHHPIPSSLLNMLKSAIVRREKNKKKAKDHQCNFCDERFSNIRQHTEHTLKHMAEKNGCPVPSFNCPLCENKYPTIWGVLNHILFHPDDGSNCLKCNKPFKHTNSLLIHFYKTHFEVPVEILKLTNGVISKWLENSTNRRRVANRILYKCDSCALTFIKKMSYEKHDCNCNSGNAVKIREISKTDRKRHNRFRITNYKCSICAEEFNSRAIYNKHIVSHEVTSEANSTEFSCPLCDKKFGNLPNMFIHQSWHPKSDNIVCLKCNAVFKRRDDLTIHHHQEHHPIPSSLFNMLKSAIVRREKYKTKAKDHHCDFCDERFSNIRQHTEHTLKHMAEKNGCPMPSFNCPLCENKFLTIWGLLTHVLFHPNDGSNCLKCNEFFEDNNSLLIHFCNIHFYVPEDIRKFVVGLISNSLENPRNAKRRGTNRILYKCKRCEASFAREKLYKKHYCMKKVRVKGKRTGKLSVSKENSNKPQQNNSLSKVRTRDATEDKKSEEIVGVKSKSKVIYDCSVCGKKFYQKKRLAKHILELHPENKELEDKFCCHCSLCDSSFASQAQLGIHLLTHGIFRQCPICKENFSSKELFMTHMTDSHSGTSGEKFFEHGDSFVCLICGVLKDDRYKITKHIKIHLDKSFICDICGVGFAFEQYLNDHILRVHKTKEKSFVCEKCGKRFKTKLELNAHIKQVHAERIPCKECGNTFSCLESYQGHYIAIHTNEKPFKCNICQKAYSSPVALRYHKITACEKSKAKISECSICHKTFENAFTLSHHKSNVHKYGCDEDVCKVCDKTFKNAANLYHHNRTYHTGAPNSKYICNVCQKTRGSKRLVFIHWLTHRPESAYECEICNTSFKQYTKFLRHKRKQHKDAENIKIKTNQHIYRQLKRCFETEKPFTQISEDGPIVTGNSPQQTTADLNGNTNAISINLKDTLHDRDTPLIENGVPAAPKSQIVNFSTTSSYIDFSRANVPVSVCTENRPAVSSKLPVNDSDEITNNPRSENLPPRNIDDFEEPATLKECRENAGNHSDTGSLPTDINETDADNDLSMEDQKPIIFEKDLFPQDPFAKKLVVSLQRLKKYTCNICNIELYSRKHYKTHENSRAHRNLKRKSKKTLPNTDINEEIGSDEDDELVSTRKKPKGVRNKANVRKLGNAVTGEALFTCPFCDEKFEVMSRFRKHLTSHKKNIKCLLCEQKFAPGGSLTKHYIKDHDGQMIEYCAICQKGYTQYSDGLRKHMRFVHGDQNQSKPRKARNLPKSQLICDFCGERFGNDRLEYWAHLISHNGEQNCIICLAVFKTLSELENHCNEVHNGEMPFKCNKCPQSFCLKARLKLHEKENHVLMLERDPTDMKFVCNTCGVRMPGKQAMINHKLTHATKEERAKANLCCEICGKSFTQLSSLTIHKRLHTGEKPFQCNICEMAFISKSVLREHIRGVHENGYTCHICGESFRRFSNIHRHVKTHAEKQDKSGKKIFCNKIVRKNIFPCDICSKTLPTETQLVKHKRAVHSNKGNSNVFTCEICSLEFYQEISLQKHSRLHDPNRPFGCDLCTHRFNHITNLNYHKKTQHKGNLNVVHSNKGNSTVFTCEICALEFYQEISLQKHSRLHDLNRPFGCDLCTHRFNHITNLNYHKKTQHKAKLNVPP